MDSGKVHIIINDSEESPSAVSLVLFCFLR